MAGDFLNDLVEKSVLSTDPVKHLYVLPDDAPMFKDVEEEGVQLVCRNVLNETVVLSFIKASAHVKTTAAIATKHRRANY